VDDAQPEATYAAATHLIGTFELARAEQVRKRNAALVDARREAPRPVKPSQAPRQRVRAVCRTNRLTAPAGRSLLLTPAHAIDALALRRVFRDGAGLLRRRFMAPNLARALRCTDALLPHAAKVDLALAINGHHLVTARPARLEYGADVSGVRGPLGSSAVTTPRVPAPAHERRGADGCGWRCGLVR